NVAMTFSAELAYYSNYANGVISGIQPVPNPPNPDLNSAQGGIQIQTTRQLLYLRTTTPPSPYFCAVFPVSVGMTNVSGYFTPKAGQGQTQVNPEYVSVGVPDYDNMMSHLVEWIGYYHVDTTKKQLLCDDKINLDNAISRIEKNLRHQVDN